MSERPKVLIVGGGSLTAAIAAALASFDVRGVDVVVVEEPRDPSPPRRITEAQLMEMILPPLLRERPVRTHPTGPRKERRK